MIKIFLAGSPCTYWSISRQGRETIPSGIGWELFENCLVAIDKFKPDIYLYENNKSMAKAICQEITTRFQREPICINSSLVSAQHRERLYWTNIDGVEQPADRGILLRDILEPWDQVEKTYQLSEKALAYMERRVRDGRNPSDFGHHNHGDADKAHCVTANIYKTVPYNTLIQPVRIGTIENNAKNTDYDSKQYRVYSPDAKATTLCANGGGVGAKTGLYATPHIGETPTGITVYHVENGKIFVGENRYDIKADDGDYIIRKLTPTECEKLQTLPVGYTEGVSSTRRYQTIGNGWTAEVIKHILSFALDGVPRDEELLVLSLYDGISTGRYVLESMGFTNIKYHAYEIDPYAIQIAKKNYPDTIHHGDAFQVRDDDWNIKE